MSDGVSTSKSRFGRFLLIFLTACALLLIVAALLYAGVFGPVDPNAQTTEFVVSPDESVDTIATTLAAQGYVRGSWVFALAYLRESGGHPIRPGGYKISKAMDAWTIAANLVQPPFWAYVTVPVGYRKEQIGDLLADELGWSPEEVAEWDTSATEPGTNYAEGVYYPDTYFIPTNESPALVAERMRDRFKEVFAPYADEAVKENVPWPRVLTIASLIEREAGSAADMPIISGIIQNRLKLGMPLAIDATLQYMTGTEGNWWPVPQSANSYPDSPFNTYKRKGLPPAPIAEPSLTAIDAALNPASTNCLFYIHDTHGVMHCSATYAGQQANVAKYLK